MEAHIHLKEPDIKRALNWIDIEMIIEGREGNALHGFFDVQYKRNIHLIMWLIRHVDWRKSHPKWHPLFWFAVARWIVSHWNGVK
jgi:hypothetical protein